MSSVPVTAILAVLSVMSVASVVTSFAVVVVVPTVTVTVTVSVLVAVVYHLFLPCAAAAAVVVTVTPSLRRERLSLFCRKALHTTRQTKPSRAFAIQALVTCVSSFEHLRHLMCLRGASTCLRGIGKFVVVVVIVVQRWQS